MWLASTWSGSACNRRSSCWRASRLWPSFSSTRASSSRSRPGFIWVQGQRHRHWRQNVILGLIGLWGRIQNQGHNTLLLIEGDGSPLLHLASVGASRGEHQGRQDCEGGKPFSSECHCACSLVTHERLPASRRVGRARRGPPSGTRSGCRVKSPTLRRG